VKEYDKMIKELADKGYTRHEIASQTGLSYARVSYALYRAGHPVEEKVKSWDAGLARRLASEGLTAEEIARACGTKRINIQTWAIRVGVNLTPGTKPTAMSREELEGFLGEGLSPTQIQEVTGVKRDSIYKLKDKWNLGKKQPRLVEAIDLPALVAKGLTINEIVKQTGISYTTIHKACERKGLKPKKEDRYSPGPNFDADLMRVLIERHDLSHEEAAKILGASRSNVSKWSLRLGVKSRKTEEVETLLKFGLDVKTVASVVGVSLFTVYKIRREMGSNKANGTKGD
jgi:predicted transcriptional regulator